MSISEPFIRRPIATSLLMLGVLVFGIGAYNLLPVAPVPNVDFPTIQISANLPGANPDTMAAAVATPLENVAVPLELAGRADAFARAKVALASVGLAHRLTHLPGQLSGGEQQRVAIARALVNEPAVLLADEPTGDLDEQNAAIIMDLIERLHRAHRLTSILATHNAALAKRCDRVLQLKHGAVHPDAAFQQAPVSATEGEKS